MPSTDPLKDHPVEAAKTALRTATKNELTALKADGSNLTATQSKAIDDQVAAIDAEEAGPPAPWLGKETSVADGIPYGLRTAKPARPVITSALAVSATSGTASTFPLTASYSPTKFNAAPLPTGVTLNATTGVLSFATGTVAGEYEIIVSAENANGKGPDAVLTLTVESAG